MVAAHVGSEGGRDGELVEAVRAGNHDAFAALYRAHAPAVAKAVSAHVSGRDLVADAVQEAFTRALDRLDTLRDPDRFRPWLMSIARNVATDYGRTRTREAPHESPADTVAAAGPGPDELAELGELARLVHGSVGGLSQRDAMAVSMVIQLGFTPTDVAAALGVAPNAAKVMLHRARRRLRDALGLELLVRRRTKACADFQALVAADDLVGAGRHLRGCAVCTAAVEDEVDQYDAATTPRPDPPA